MAKFLFTNRLYFAHPYAEGGKFNVIIGKIIQIISSGGLVFFSQGLISGSVSIHVQ